MARKLRVYEIAKELGLSNKEALDLCLALGVDVKNHSSSIEEAHVDRIRRRAQRDHLGIYAEAAQAAPAEPAPAPPQGEEPLPPVAEPLAPPAPVAEGRRLDLAAVIAEEAAKREEAEQAAIENAAQAPARRQTPLSPSGKPIPPPPRPQPARDGRSRPAREGGGRPTGGGAGRTGAPRPPLGGGARPGGSGFRPPARTGGAGAPAPRFGGGFGAGRPGGGRSRGVRPNKSRRRISRKEFEELEPTMATTYVPSNEPVPEHEVIVERGSTAQEVAPKLNRSPGDMVRFLLMQGEMVTATQSLSDEMIELYAAELGAKVRLVDPGQEQEAELAAKYLENDDTLDPAAEVPRPPVVTVMGHVDHGKTLLLDRIRHTNVVAGEAGGITQHIGAYQVHHGDKVVTFLDTPGHEAFTAMRARGARVTDIAVIVVAADDGVKPQTQEAVDHAKEAGVPIVVAVNKIDKEGADPNRVRGEMAAIGVQPVEWGGDVDFVDVSAKTKQGLGDLLDTIVTLAELLELRANPNAPASGTVIESKLDPGRGPVVTILIERGTLHVGDALLAGATWGRVRAMHDFLGARVERALPGEPVEVLGFDGVPQAGEHVRVVEHERRAKQLAAERAARLKAEALARRSSKRVSLEDIFKSGTQELALVLKADVAGSLEAIEDEIARLPQEEVQVRVIHRGVGAVTESDVMLAAASGAIILAFNVRPVGDARALAEREGVEIRHYSVIYRAIDELRSAMEGMLAPEEVEETLGSAEVRQIFRASRVGTIAGCHVTEGTVRRGNKVRLVRDGTVVYDGEIASLRRFNDDVREVNAGFDCGIVLRDFADIKEGDVLEAYATRLLERELA